MATADISAFHDMIGKGVCQMEWSFAGVTGVGFAMNAQNMPDKTLHVRCDLFAGGTTNVVIEGTNEATPTTTRWKTLVDVHENSLDLNTINATGILETILDNPRYIRPRVPTVTTAVTSPIVVTIIAQGQLR